MKRIKQFLRHHRLSREWRIVRHPAAILGMDVRRLAAAFDVLFKKSLHVWTEPETDAPGHKRHPDVLWYHQYVCRFVCEMGEYFVRFSVKECRGRGGNAVHSSTITAVSMYKAQGARATDPGKDQGEANAPFVDNKLSLFFSAVNGVRPIVRMWWNFLDGVHNAFGF